MLSDCRGNQFLLIPCIVPCHDMSSHDNVASFRSGNETACAYSAYNFHNNGISVGAVIVSFFISAKPDKKQ
jgi:hypothetical protein